MFVYIYIYSFFLVVSFCNPGYGKMKRKKRRICNASLVERSSKLNWKFERGLEWFLRRVYGAVCRIPAYTRYLLPHIIKRGSSIERESVDDSPTMILRFISDFHAEVEYYPPAVRTLLGSHMEREKKRVQQIYPVWRRRWAIFNANRDFLHTFL